MSSPSMSEKHLDLRYLRLKTTNLKDEQSGTISQDGLLTPLSANYENRRPSITSCSWSFLSQTSSRRSQSSSIGSISQDSLIPPSHGVGRDGLLIAPEMSHIPNNREKHFLDGPLQSTYGSPALEMASSKSYWIPSLQHAQVPMKQPQSGADAIVSVSADLPMSFSVDLEQKVEQVSVNLSDYSKPWTGSTIMQDMPACVGFGNGTYNQSSPLHGIPSQFSNQESWGMLTSDMGIDVATIIPTQTMVEVTPALCDDRTEMDISSPEDPTLWDNSSFQDVKTEGDLPDIDMQQSIDFSTHSPCSTYTPMNFPSRESNRAGKKPKRTCSKRKSLPSYSEGGDVELRDKLGLKCSVELSQSSKKHRCHECNSKFQRIEHLRRHLDIHKMNGPSHRCPDPECGREFKSRADNLREHFKTHLRQTSTRRNLPRAFDEFYDFIRNSHEIPYDQGEKYIAKLENWRAQGGHLKSDNGSGGRSRMG